jgi:hypothetical protein
VASVVTPASATARELARDKLALEGRQHRQGVGLGSDPGHVDLDKLDPRYDRQQLAHRRLHRRQNRPFVQSHAFLDPVSHHRSEGICVVGEEHQKRVQVERPRTEPRLIARQGHFADLDLTARTPGQHRRGAGRGETVDHRIGHAGGIIEISFAELIHAAALSRPAHDLVIDPEKIEHVEAQQRDVRGLQDIASCVEDDIGRAMAQLLRGLPSDTGQCLGRQLQP